MEIGVIVNPNSRKNKRRPGRARHLAGIVGARGLVTETPTTHDIKPALRDFLRRHLRYWVADGGDGTLHWLLNEGNAVLREQEFLRCEMPVAVPTNGGTIDFVAKKAGIAGDASAILRDLSRHVDCGTLPDEVEIDTLSIRMLSVSGRWVERIGFACAAGGVGQRFFSHYYSVPEPTNRTIIKVFGYGFLSLPFNFTPLGRLPKVPPQWGQYSRHLFRPTRAQVSIDGGVLPWSEHTVIQVGSIDINLGGIVRVFARAAGRHQLHFMAGDASPRDIVANIPNMLLGRNMRAKKLWDGVGKTMSIEAAPDELLGPVIDGELYCSMRRIDISLGPSVRLPRVGQRGASTGGIMRLGDA